VAVNLLTCPNIFNFVLNGNLDLQFKIDIVDPSSAVLFYMQANWGILRPGNLREGFCKKVIS
jgi:hypothetical protein